MELDGEGMGEPKEELRGTAERTQDLTSGEVPAPEL